MSYTYAGTTHWEECFKDHHECAIESVLRLKVELADVTAERDALLQEIKDCHQHVAFLKRLMANGRF
jgi:hypothetical protein